MVVHILEKVCTDFKLCTQINLLQISIDVLKSPHSGASGSEVGPKATAPPLTSESQVRNQKR